MMKKVQKNGRASIWARFRVNGTTERKLNPISRLRTKASSLLLYGSVSLPARRRRRWPTERMEIGVRIASAAIVMGLTSFGSLVESA